MTGDSKDPFARLHARLFVSALSEEALLRGLATRVVTERGTQQLGEAGQVMAYRIVVALQVADDPKEGDAVTLAEGDFIIDALLDDDGYSVRCVLREA